MAGPIDRMRQWIGERLQRSSVIAQLVPTWQVGRKLPKPTDFKRLTDEGYRKNAIINACIREKATSVAEPELQVLQVGDEGETVPAGDRDRLVRLLRRPNPIQSAYEFLEELVVHHEASGNAFTHKVRAEGSNVVELWNLRPDRMDIVPNDEGRVAHYVYKVGEEKHRLEPQDVIHFRQVDPLNDHWGLSPIYTIALWGDIDTDASKFLRSFFINRGQIPGYLKLEGKVPREERERLKRLWKEEHTGEKGWHTVPVFDAGANYVQTGTDLSELDLENVFGESELRICSAFGVPPIIVGVKAGLDRSTFANYEEARTSFWHETLVPMYRRFEQKLTAELATEFGERPRREIRFDLSGVEALKDDRLEERKLALLAWNDGVLRRNEVRRVLSGLMDMDFDDLEGGDVVKERPTEIVIPTAVESEDQGRLIRALLSGGPGQSNGGEGTPRPNNRLQRFVDTAAEDEFWRRIHEIADELTPEIEERFLAAVDEVRGSIDFRVLERAIEEGRIEAVVQQLNLDRMRELLGEAGDQQVLETIREGVERAGEAAARDLSLMLDVDVVFDQANPRAVRWAREHAAKAVVQVTDETRDALRGMIADAIEEGVGTRRTAREIADELGDSLGLTRQQVSAVESFRERLEQSGLSADEVNQRVARFRRAKLGQRAERIARNETITAANQGQQELWEQAAEEGLMDADTTVREVIVTPDERLCEICAPMEGQRRQLGNEFVSPFDGTRALRPPFHIQCRCALGLVFDAEEREAAPAAA